MEREAAAGVIQSVMTRRAKVDEALDGAIAALDQPAMAALAPTRKALETGRSAVRALRGTIDAELAKPTGGRDKSLGATVATTGGQFLDGLEAASFAIEGELQAVDPRLAFASQIRVLAWATRKFSGDHVSSLNGPVAEARPFKDTELKTYQTSMAQIQALWGVLRGITAGSTTPPVIAAARRGRR